LTTIALATELFQRVDSGEKRQTIRKGRRDYPLGPAVLTDDGDEQRDITITRVIHGELRDVTFEHAQADGFETLDDLHATLRRFYPDISDTDDVTIVSFAVCGSGSGGLA
jgi:hypothetical protein